MHSKAWATLYKLALSYCNKKHSPSELLTLFCCCHFDYVLTITWRKDVETFSFKLSLYTLILIPIVKISKGISLKNCMLSIFSFSQHYQLWKKKFLQKLYSPFSIKTILFTHLCPDIPAPIAIFFLTHNVTIYFSCKAFVLA